MPPYNFQTDTDINHRIGVTRRKLVNRLFKPVQAIGFRPMLAGHASVIWWPWRIIDRDPFARMNARHESESSCCRANFGEIVSFLVVLRGPLRVYAP